MSFALARAALSLVAVITAVCRDIYSIVNRSSLCRQPRLRTLDCRPALARSLPLAAMAGEPVSLNALSPQELVQVRRRRRRSLTAACRRHLCTSPSQATSAMWSHARRTRRCGNRWSRSCRR